MAITKRTALKYLGAAFVGGVAGRATAESIPDTAGDILAGLYHAKGDYTDIPREELNKITTKVISQRPDKLAVVGATGAVVGTFIWSAMSPK